MFGFSWKAVVFKTGIGATCFSHSYKISRGLASTVGLSPSVLVLLGMRLLPSDAFALMVRLDTAPLTGPDGRTPRSVKV